MTSWLSPKITGRKPNIQQAQSRPLMLQPVSQGQEEKGAGMEQEFLQQGDPSRVWGSALAGSRSSWECSPGLSSPSFARTPPKRKSHAGVQNNSVKHSANIPEGRALLGRATKAPGEGPRHCRDKKVQGILWGEVTGPALRVSPFFLFFFALHFLPLSLRGSAPTQGNKGRPQTQNHCPEKKFKLQPGVPPNKMNTLIPPLERFNFSFQPQASSLVLQLSLQTSQTLPFSR